MPSGPERSQDPPGEGLQRGGVDDTADINVYRSRVPAGGTGTGRYSVYRSRVPVGGTGTGRHSHGVQHSPHMYVGGDGPEGQANAA